MTGFEFSLSKWWPLFLILIGVGSISKGSRTGGLIVIAVGVVFLLSNLDILSVSFWLLWPVALIAIGVAILRGQSRSRNAAGDAPAAGDDLNVSALFSGSNQRIDSQRFNGGNVSVTFGGAEIDLRGAAMDERRGHRQRQRGVRRRQAPGAPRLGRQRPRRFDIRRRREEAPRSRGAESHAHRHRLVPLRRHRDYVLTLTGGTP